MTPFRGNAPDAAGGFQGADQGAGAEVVDEVVLVQRGLEAHPGFGDVGKEDGDLRAVAQEADPGEVFAPGEEFGVDEVHFLVVEEVHRPLGVFSLINDAGPDQVEEIHRGHDLLYGFVFAFAVGAAFGAGEVLEAGGGDQQEACLGLPLFQCFIHIVWILS